MNNEFVVIHLPPYVANLAYDFTIQLTHIYDGQIKTFSSTEVKNNQFTVYGKNGKFFWLANGTRGEIEAEPFKATTNIQGTGPYRWVQPSISTFENNF
jgi:hypothetical protein